MRYVPDFNTQFGFKVAAVFGSHPHPEAVNLEAEVNAAFNRNGGLSFIQVRGDLYVMSGLEGKKAKKMFWGNADFRYQRRPQGSSVDGHLNLYMDAKAMEGSGPNKLMVHAAFHAGPDSWYLHAGDYYNRGGIRVKSPFRVSASTYLMIGHGIPPYLPPPTGVLKDFFDQPRLKSGSGKISFTPARTGNPRAGGMSDFKTGQGFAFGLACTAGVGFDASIVSGRVEGTVGGDIKVMKTNFCRGLDGWQGAGQAYAGLSGYLKVLGFEIASLKAGVILSGGGPDPIGFEGQAKVKFKVVIVKVEE